MEYVPYTGPVVTWSEAKSAGLPRYFTGKPCKRGHVAERLTLKNMCVVCKAAASLAAYHADPQRFLARTSAAKKADRARVNELQTAWRLANKDRLREQRREANKRNAERMRAARAVKYEANAKALRAKTRSWMLANPEKVSAGRGNRRARIKSAEGTHTAEDIRRIGEAQGWRCHWCRKPTRKGYHVDHIQPLAKAGSNWPRNLCIACADCNRTKYTADPIAFAQRKGLLL